MQTIGKTLIMGAVLLLAVPLYAQTSTSTSGSQSHSTANVNASQGNSQSTSASGGGADLSLTQISTTPDGVHYSGSETVKTNPGMVLEGPGMSYTVYNCANGSAAGGSTFWASFSYSGSKESIACNFRANAALQAQVDATPTASQIAHDDMSMAQYIACTTANDKVLKACIALGLVINADTPATTTSDTWHACHVNATMLGACKRENLISQNDEPLPNSH